MIFYHDEKQKEEAEESKEKLDKSGLYDRPIVTKIRKAETFYIAEDYHQYYYKKNPDHYNRYYKGSGRAKYINKITEVNKIFLEKVIQKGDVVIDATMGNGYDTVYLGNLVGENGKVYAFDVQEEAIKSTIKKVERDDMTSRVELILDGHENLDAYVIH